jgi:ABC-2 type transport system ATP-binding protein
MSVVISAKDVGIEFYTSRRRKLQVRDLLFHGSTGTNKDTFWALKDISFDIRKGEAVGLVGGNGSGKSTLLKTIAGVLLPDEGEVRVDGGVAPLIELTGGFRGELTCRDNLWV